MNKKFSKTILSSAVAGLLLVSGGAMAEDIKIGDNYIIRISENNESARLLDKSGKDALLGLINTKTGAITTVNKTELEQKIKNTRGVEPQRIMESIRYTIDAPSLKKENINKLTSADLDKIKANVEVVSKTITSETAPVYREAIQNGMTSEDALAVVNQDKTGGLLKQFNGLNTNVNALKNATTFAIDENGEITDGQGVETVSVKSVVADVKADTTIYQNKDGSYTLDQSAPGNVRVNDAVVSLDNRTRSNTQAIQN
ncbi:hypothetical protein ACM50H_005017, partial [Escherichia coli]|nr:hypothetical protein [Escherichia coli]EFA0978616.1 hypothetical protein [Escherichia coli]EFH4486905.1 hypothetical protein [Escherichia coli]EFK4577709.1 hypothetical protein [Escherichia coli]MDA6714407.1 hypothetical protein [Escherichia coli]